MVNGKAGHMIGLMDWERRRVAFMGLGANGEMQIINADVLCRKAVVEPGQPPVWEAPIGAAWDNFKVLFKEHLAGLFDDLKVIGCMTTDLTPGPNQGRIDWVRPLYMPANQLPVPREKLSSIITPEVTNGNDIRGESSSVPAT